MLTSVTPSLLLWNSFFVFFVFSHAYFLLLGQKLLGYYMTGQNIGRGRSDIDFHFFICYRSFELKSVVFTHLGYKERYFVENRAVELFELIDMFIDS